MEHRMQIQSKCMRFFITLYRFAKRLAGLWLPLGDPQPWLCSHHQLDVQNCTWSTEVRFLSVFSCSEVFVEWVREPGVSKTRMHWTRPSIRIFFMCCLIHDHSCQKRSVELAEWRSCHCFWYCFCKNGLQYSCTHPGLPNHTTFRTI